eukprot:s2271_g1.t1
MIDAETLKLSLALVGKATGRILAALRQVGAAATDAVSRGGHCAAHTTAVCRFADGRSAAEAEAGDAAEALPLPAPEEARSGYSSPEQDTLPPRRAPPAPAAKANSEACDPSSPVSRAFQLELQARLQNDRLLRQLHSDLRELRKRAGAGLSQRGFGTCSPETYGMVAELLHAATDSVVEAFVPDAELFRTLLSEHFDFVEACGSEVQAISCDLRAQLLQYLLLADSQAVLTALEHQVEWPETKTRSAFAMVSIRYICSG